MAEEPDSLVLRFLRVVDQKIDRLSEDMRDMKVRVGRIETGQAQMHTYLAELSVRMDRIDSRIERIERRLALADTEA